MATFTRQPFGELGAPRLQALQSAKNRQNSILPSMTSSMKPVLTPSTGKRSRGPEIFEDFDAENVDPSVYASPSKKSKGSFDAGFVKPARFSLTTSPIKSGMTLSASPSVPSIRKTLSSPNTARSTPITASRGSPKHKRISAISKRRASSSPYRRVDPVPFSQSSPSLPFSIDAALSGTISSYTPKSSIAATPATAPAPITPTAALDDTMPKSWFFDIHEDTPEQEAANLMEHSAAVLDISSDDDIAAKYAAELAERGKENIPPPDFLAAQPQVQGLTGEEASGAVIEQTKRPRLRHIAQDAMDEDRRPLGDLVPSEFYGKGCDASTFVTVDVGIEKPSGLSREVEVENEVEIEEVDVHIDLDQDVQGCIVVEETQVVVEPAALEEGAVCVDDDLTADDVATIASQEEVAATETAVVDAEQLTSAA